MAMEMIEQMDFVFNGVAISFQPESLVYTDADNPSLRGPGPNLVGHVYPDGVNAEFRDLVIEVTGDLEYETADGSLKIDYCEDLIDWLDANGFGGNNRGLEKADKSGALMCSFNCWYEVFDRTPGSVDSETHIVGYSVMEILEKCADYIGKTTNGVST